MTAGLFVTGTDTGCGKTEVAVGLMRGFAARGERVLGMKPVAAGALWGPAGLRNDDAERLRAAGNSMVDYDVLNPYCFEPAIAPHIAAAEVDVRIDPNRLLRCRDRLAAQCDRLVVEGAGGWRVPLDGGLDMAGLARHLGYPVLLVVGMRLGCLNHARLTVESIAAEGLPLAGWVANRVDPAMERFEENLATLRSTIPAPLIGNVPFFSPSSEPVVADFLSLSALQDCGQRRQV